MALILAGSTLVWPADKADFAALTISVIPNLLGFTVGALAILLAFSSSAIFSTVAEEGAPASLFMKMAANFVHFISVQILALMSAMTLNLTGSEWLKPLTAFFAFYGVLTVLSAGVQLFQVARIYNASASLAAGAPTQDEPDAGPQG